MAVPRVFISMGTPYTDAQRSFRDALETFLRDQCGVDPRIIGKNEHPPGNPLPKIKELMSTCSGVLVVAYERKHIKVGTEKREGPQPTKINDAAFTTPWNHVESAMAYSLGIPQYIICQRDLIEEALIETKEDWYVQYVDINPEVFLRPEVTQSIRSWIDTRVANQNRKPRLLKVIEGGVGFSEITPKEMVKVGAILGSVFALGAATARLWPKMFS
jgi:hypothetical protein